MMNIQIELATMLEGLCVAQGWLQRAQLKGEKWEIAMYQRIYDNAKERYDELKNRKRVKL